ncbi:MAG: WYL domain-containing protein, partial [Propioniciclava sp.]
PPGRWIVEYHPTLAVEERPDGVTRVRFLVADSAWLRRLLLRLGPAVVGVDPPEAARSAIQAARDALSGEG